MTIEIKDTRGMRVMLLGDTHPVGRPELWSIYIEPTGDNLERLCLGGNFPRSEVLAALRAVDEVDVVAAERAANELQAKLTEAEATIERVGDVMNEFYKVRGDWHSWTGANALKASLEAALAPEPAFVLPTEVPARIIAEESDGTEHEFTLWSDGKGGTSWWHDCEDADEEGALYSDARLMRDFTDHRLLDGDS